MRVWYLKGCDTCRNALRALEGRVSDMRELRADGVPEELLAEWLDRLGADALVNRRSTTWRNLGAEERDEDALTLLRRHPTLLRRPVIESDGAVHLGWSEAVRESLGVVPDRGGGDV